MAGNFSRSGGSFQRVGSISSVGKVKQSRNGKDVIAATFGDGGQYYTVYVYYNSQYVPSSGRNSGKTMCPVQIVKSRRGGGFSGSSGGRWS